MGKDKKKKKEYKDLLIMMFPNGVTAVFDGNEQVSGLQESWIRLYFDFLQSKGIDPTGCKFIMPDGMTMCVLKNKEGQFCWDISNGK